MANINSRADRKNVVLSAEEAQAQAFDLAQVGMVLGAIERLCILRTDNILNADDFETAARALTQAGARSLDQVAAALQR